ncbi:MAG TPA: phosphotransferase family protein [Solirubrobacteraceae bacterium]|nr:phosphotransferase family protein [Solirubrobacteraceae bacterium]
MSGPSAPQLRTRALELGPYLSARLGGDGSVADARLAGEGMSDTTLLVDLRDGRELVLRAHSTTVAGTGVESPERHFAVLRAVHPVAGVPSPEPLLLESDPAPLGAPFMIIGRLPGRAVVPWSREGCAFLRSTGAGPAGRELLAILASIHAVDPAALAGALDPPPAGTAAAAQAVARLRAAIERDRDGPEPALTDALGWLEAHLPACAQPALVHGDYRAGNLLFDGGHITGVLDWEFAHLGDPARDIAWLMAASNRVGDELACDMVPMGEVVERYEGLTGRAVDPAALTFWDLFMLVENAALWVRTTASWRRGEVDDVRIARWSYTLPRTRRLVLDALERT